MSDGTLYHVLGQQQDPSDPRTQPTAPQFSPPIASSPAGYYQGVTSGQQVPQPSQGQGQYGGPQQGGYRPTGMPMGTPSQEQGYFQSQNTGRLGTPGTGMAPATLSPNTLAQSVGSMGINDTAVPARHGKKTRRHAHHDLDQPGVSSQAFNGLPQGATYPSQHPYAGQPMTPAMNQFPAQAGSAFIPPANPIAAGETTMHVGGPGSSANRVDPEQVPSIPRARDASAKYYLDHIYLTMEQHLAPPSVVPYVAYDQGNSSPKYARLTLNNIPSSSEALAAAALPLGLVLQPLAPLQEGEQPIPVLDFGEQGPPRCRRCRAYINPFMTFRSGGNKFVCNMCTFPNDVPQDYFAPTDPSGVRVDREQRPELKLGTVEFVVPKEYWAKEPVGLRWLFLIDVGQNAINQGFLEAFCYGILGALYGEDEPQDADEENGAEERRRIPLGSKVGFVTFDKDIHFYNCNAKLDHPQMLVMPDIEDPFVPLGSDGLFSDPYESRLPITSLLTQLPKLFSNIKNPEPALLPTLNAALGSLKETGGKIICSLSALPTWGPGRLFMRDEGKLHGIETEKKLFQTENLLWKKTASDMVQSGVGVDFFIAPPGGAYMDVATIGHVSALSGGETYFYPNFNAPRDNLKVSLELKHNITRETGYQALMKVRCSNGLQVSAYHGNFQQHTFGADLEFGTIDADKAVGVMFSYDGKLDPKLDAHFQCALLYTTANGERRVRCTNTVASVSEGGSESMRYIDQDAVVTMIAKDAATRMTERTLKELRGSITEKTIDILAGYRKAFSKSQPPGQLVLPENLKEFGMYTLSLLKCKAFKAGAEHSDRRTHTMRLIKAASPLDISLLLYPRIYALHNLPPEAGFPDPQSQQLVTPPALRASFSRIEDGGAYLVDDGQSCLLWLHAQVSPNLLEDLFGEGFTTLRSLPADLSQLPVLQTHLNAQARNLLAYWGSLRGSKGMTVQLARQAIDGAELEFARLLVEDRNSEAQSYVDWLVHVHRGVQMELSGQRKKEGDGAGDGIKPSVRLRRAIYLDDLVLVKRIVQNNPQCLRSPDLGNKNNTTLHLAASLGALKIADFLISAGHEDEGTSRNGNRETPLMLAVSVAGGEGSRSGLVTLLASRFPHCIPWQNAQGLDAFMLAARHDVPAALGTLLSLSPHPAALLAATDHDGNTALHYASAYGNMKCIRALVYAGANPSARNAFSWTAVSYSSTVAAEVYFRSLVTELERRREEMVEREREMGRRREGGLRLVTAEEHEDGERAGEGEGEGEEELPATPVTAVEGRRGSRTEGRKR